MFKVSQSKINTWQRCGYQYHLKYIQRLRKNKKARPLLFGSIIHDMDDAVASGKDPFKALDKWYRENTKLFREEIDMYGNIIEDIRVLYKEYQITHKSNSLIPLKINGKKAEHKIEAPLNKHILFVGRADRVVRAKESNWLYERKTFTKQPDTDARWRSVQSASYIATMAIMGWPTVVGTVWDYFRSKAPSEPQILKSGEVSTRDLDTLPTKLLEFQKREKISNKVMAPLLQKAEARRKDYFPRVFSPIKPRVINAIMQDVVEISTIMAKNHHTRKDRHIGQHCSWCDFELICRAEMQGLDVKSIKERNYHREEYKEEVRETSQD